jgi:hypothetical protein
MVSKQVPYTVTKQFSFDMLVTTAYTSLCNAGRIPTARTKVVVPLGAAFVASLLSAVFSQPGDTLLSKVNAHYTEGGVSSSDDEGGEVSSDGYDSLYQGHNEGGWHIGILRWDEGQIPSCGHHCDHATAHLRFCEKTLWHTCYRSMLTVTLFLFI